MPITYCHAKRIFPGATLWVQVDAGDFQHSKIWLLAEIISVKENPPQGQGAPRAEAVILTSDRTILWFALDAFHERTPEPPPEFAWVPIKDE